jgi:hypothetical protein
MHRNLLGILLISACVGAQPCTGAEPATAPTDVLEEVLVRGIRLRELKASVVEAEDRFYARYNNLNKVDIFDIECRVEAPLGTKIPQRWCLTNLQLKARREYAREYLLVLQDMAKFGYDGLGKPPDTNPEAVWASRYEEYKANMLQLLNQHPELRRLADEGEEARKRFDAEYKRRLNGRLILME